MIYKWVGDFTGGNFPRGIFTGGNFLGEKFLGVIFPDVRTFRRPLGDLRGRPWDVACRVGRLINVYTTV